jgi:hypothetical protein
MGVGLGFGVGFFFEAAQLLKVRVTVALRPPAAVAVIATLNLPDGSFLNVTEWCSADLVKTLFTLPSMRIVAFIQWT